MSQISKVVTFLISINNFWKYNFSHFYRQTNMQCTYVSIFILLFFLLNTETSNAINSPRVINRQGHSVRRRQTFSNPCLTGTIGGTNHTSQNSMVNFHNSVGNVPGNMFDSSSQLMSWTGPSAQNSVTLDTADGANFINGNCCYSVSWSLVNIIVKRNKSVCQQLVFLEKVQFSKHN